MGESCVEGGVDGGRSSRAIRDQELPTVTGVNIHILHGICYIKLYT